MSRSLLVAVLLKVVLVDGKEAKSTSFIVEEIERCDIGPAVSSDILEMDWKKCNRTHKCAQIKLNTPEELGPESSVQLLGSKWNGGWSRNTVNLKIDYVCKFFDKVIGDLWLNLKAAMKLDCPIKIGNYSVSNYQINGMQANVPLFFMNGKYKIRAILRNHGKLRTCRDVVCLIKQ